MENIDTTDKFVQGFTPRMFRLYIPVYVPSLVGAELFIPIGVSQNTDTVYVAGYSISPDSTKDSLLSLGDMEKADLALPQLITLTEYFKHSYVLTPHFANDLQVGKVLHTVMDITAGLCPCKGKTNPKLVKLTEEITGVQQST